MEPGKGGVALKGRYDPDGPTEKACVAAVATRCRRLCATTAAAATVTRTARLSTTFSEELFPTLLH